MLLYIIYYAFNIVEYRSLILYPLLNLSVLKILQYLMHKSMQIPRIEAKLV